MMKAVMRTSLTPEDQYDTSLPSGFVDIRHQNYNQYQQSHWNYPSPPISNATPPQTMQQQQHHHHHHSRAIQPPSPTDSNYGYPKPRTTIDLSGSMPSYTISDHYSQPMSLHAAPRPMDTGMQSGSFITSTPQNYPPVQSHRRTKSHVASACVNCKKAHLACDVRRPCPRCVGLGKQDSCKDVQHKKRGRPRLRDERHAFEIEQTDTRMQGMPTSVSPSEQQSELQRYDQPSRSYAEQAIEMPLKIRMPNMPTTAFLTIDFVVTFSSDAFQDYTGYSHIHLNKMKSLYDLVTPIDAARLQRVSNRLKDSIREIDPSYTAPSLSISYAHIDKLKVEDVALASQRSRRLQEVFDIYRSDGQLVRTTATFTLVKSGVFFIFFEIINNLIPDPYSQKISPISPQSMSHHSRRSSTFSTDPSPTSYTYSQNPSPQDYAPSRDFQPGHARRTSTLSQYQPQPVPVTQPIDLYTPRAQPQMNNSALPSLRQYNPKNVSYGQYDNYQPQVQRAPVVEHHARQDDSIHLPPLRTSSHAQQAPIDLSRRSSTTSTQKRYDQYGREIVNLSNLSGRKRARIGVSEMLV